MHIAHCLPSWLRKRCRPSVAMLIFVFLLGSSPAIADALTGDDTSDAQLEAFEARITTASLAGDLDAAARHADAALAFAQKTAGPMSLLAARLTMVRADLARRRGNADAAQSLIEAVIGMADALTNTDVSATASRSEGQSNVATPQPTDQKREAAIRIGLAAYRILADLQANHGDSVTAHATLGAALNRAQQGLSPTHPFIADILSDRASLNMMAGRGEPAIADAEAALKIRIEHHGHTHPAIAREMGKLAAILAQQGDFDRAQQFALDRLTILSRTLGSNHAQVGFAMLALGQIYAEAGEADAALEMMQRSVRIFESALGPFDLAVAQAYQLYAGALRTVGAHDRAQIMTDHARALYRLDHHRHRPSIPDAFAREAEKATKATKAKDN